MRPDDFGGFIDHSPDIAVRIDRKAGLLLVAVVAVGALAALVYSESLTLITTYPAPSGIYNQLVTTGNSGAVPADTVLNRSAGNTMLVPPTNASGKVGIGRNAPLTKLDVAGGIRPGTATAGALCGADPEGTFAYDAVVHAPIYCDNSGRWKKVGGGAGVIDWVNPTQNYVYSGFSNADYSFGSVYSLCLLVGVGTNNGGCYVYTPSAVNNPLPGNWALNLEAYGRNTNCKVSCWN